MATSPVLGNIIQVQTNIIAVRDQILRGCSRSLNARFGVIFRLRAAFQPGPLIPQQRTCGDRIGTSVSCQQLTFQVPVEIRPHVRTAPAVQVKTVACRPAMTAIEYPPTFELGAIPAQPPCSVAARLHVSGAGKQPTNDRKQCRDSSRYCRPCIPPALLVDH